MKKYKSNIILLFFLIIISLSSSRIGQAVAKNPFQERHSKSGTPRHVRIHSPPEASSSFCLSQGHQHHRPKGGTEFQKNQGVSEVLAHLNECSKCACGRKAVAPEPHPAAAGGQLISGPSLVAPRA